MVFNSSSFAIFLPIVFAIYWLTKDKYKWLILFISSYYFYMSWNAKYVFLILITTMVSYQCALLIEKTDNIKKKKLCMCVALIVCFAILFVFKYFNFALDNINKICSMFAIKMPMTMVNLILPVGISFYTFQTLGYVIDVYRGEIKAEKHFGKYAAFIAFFPQLVAGPIERASNLLPQIQNPKKFDYNNAEYGIRKMIVGFFKKMVIADNLAILVDYVHVHNLSSGPHLIMAVLGFSFQIYCDFSGYSDIAVGTAKLFNIDLMENFKSPYFAISVKDFWSRWHISLSGWFKDYLYIPLGGNRRGFIRNKLNKLIVFMVSGLWHGADWHYVVWGGIHGTAQLFNNKKKPQNEKHNVIWWLKVLITFIFISITWVFFRTGLGNAVYIVTHLLERGCSFGTSLEFIVGSTNLTYINLIVILFSIILLMVYDYFSLKRDVLKSFEKINVYVRYLIYVSAILFIIFFMPLVIEPSFIYFQF